MLFGTLAFVHVRGEGRRGGAGGALRPHRAAAPPHPARRCASAPSSLPASPRASGAAGATAGGPGKGTAVVVRRGEGVVLRLGDGQDLHRHRGRRRGRGTGDPHGSWARGGASTEAVGAQAMPASTAAPAVTCAKLSALPIAASAASAERAAPAVSTTGVGRAVRATARTAARRRQPPSSRTPGTPCSAASWSGAECGLPSESAASRSWGSARRRCPAPCPARGCSRRDGARPATGRPGARSARLEGDGRLSAAARPAPRRRVTPVTATAARPERGQRQPAACRIRSGGERAQQHAQGGREPHGRTHAAAQPPLVPRPAAAAPPASCAPASPTPRSRRRRRRA